MENAELCQLFLYPPVLASKKSFERVGVLGIGLFGIGIGEVQAKSVPIGEGAVVTFTSVRVVFQSRKLDVLPW